MGSAHSAFVNQLAAGAPARSRPGDAARALTAHAPTMRAQGQTYGIAQRLTRSERLFDK